MKILTMFLCMWLSFGFLLLSSDFEQPQQPTTLFCHGLGGNDHSELQSLITQQTVHQPAQGFQMDNNLSTCSLGNHHDVQALKKSVQLNKEHILYGRSRGGATAINYLADHASEEIKALVIDAAPSDMVNVVDEYQYQCGIFPFWTRSQKEWILRQYYPGYPKNSIPPVEKIAQIQDNAIKKIPILIAHSCKDKRVNIRSAWQNYKAFKLNGFHNVYLYELPSGSHHHNTKDANYQKVLQSFYKKYGFKHNEEKAILTESDLQNLQPTIEDIDKKIVANQWLLRQQSIINLCLASLALFYCVHKK